MVMARLLLALNFLFSACGPPRRASNGNGADASVASDLSVPCVGLKCRQANCGEQPKTSLVGKVFSPAGNLPLYNAIVYVPDDKLDPFSPGVTCDKCGAIASGKPVVATLTDAAGKFRLENVPAGKDVPLVLQIGRWRRQVVIPEIVPCVENQLDPVSDIDLQRLPRNQTEGDIPLLAIATGTYDPVECLLRKVGVADSEFTDGNGSGRIHLYRQNGLDLNPPSISAQTLYASLSTLKSYDAILLPCAFYNPTQSQISNLIAYTDAGGRAFITDLEYSWIKTAQPPFSSSADWTLTGSLLSPYALDTTFPKGMAFAQWLVNVGASKKLGELPVSDAYNRLSAANKPSQRWIYSPGGSPVLHYTFNTPINPPPADGGMGLQCGRVIYSSFHVSTQEATAGKPFPSACKSTALTAQEKALVFMLFDMTSCVQDDGLAPVDPPIM